MAATSSQRNQRLSNKRCRVCGDVARAFNYSGLSCEACKVFFRRNAPFREELECAQGNGRCRVFGVEGRQSCPKCRLERCFAIGMTRQARVYTSHGGQRRVQQVQHASSRSILHPSIPSTSGSFSSSFSPVTPSNNHRNLLTSALPSLVVRMHQTLQERQGRPSSLLAPVELFHIVQVNRLVQLTFPEETWLREVTPPPQQQQLEPNNNNVSSLVDLRFVLSRARHYSSRIHEFANLVPEFQALPRNDRHLLLRSAFSELLHLRFFFNYDHRRDGYPALTNEAGTESTFLPFSNLNDLIPNNPLLIPTFRSHARALHRAIGGDVVVRNLLFGLTLFHLDEEEGRAERAEVIRYQCYRYAWLLRRYLRQKHNIQAGDAKLHQLMAAFGGLRATKRLIVPVIRQMGYHVVTEMTDANSSQQASTSTSTSS